jgi:hypothetical protein
MLEESERFRLIRENLPEIAERILQLWGKPGLVSYINGVIDDARKDPSLGVTAKIELALYGLRKEHDRLHARQPAPPGGQVLTEDEHFKKINAQHQRIGRELKELWGGPKLGGFVNQLLQDTRGGTRQGFSPEVAAALFKLLQKHDRDFPEHALKVGDIWTGGKTL